MTLITKPDFTYVWASGGAVVAPNDTKKQQGWIAEAPPFQYDNWLQNRQDQMLAHINQRGIPAWDGLTSYEAGGLSYAQGSDGKVYKSVAASGPTATVQNPTTDVADVYWTEAFASIGSFLTQTAGDIRYTQRSNNLSDLTNISTSRANLGVAASVVAGISGSYSNLKSSATGLSAIVTITSDALCLKDSSNNQVVINGVSVTPSLATSAVNGLDAGTSTISTWYYLWVIWNGTTTAGLLSLSSTAPTMPAGYTHKARVGAVRTDGTANKYPLSFIQAGQRVQYKVDAGSNVPSLPLMASGVVSPAAAVSVSNFAPPTAGSISLVAGTTGGYIAFAPSAAYTAVAPNYLNTAMLAGAPFVGGYNASSPVPTATGEIILETSNIQFGSSASTGVLQCFGWSDNL